MQNKLFSYDDICLRPRYSELKTRAEADTSVNFLGHKFQLPIIPANMQDVISWQIASALSLNKYFYIMHRFGDANYQIDPQIDAFAEIKSISIGVKDEEKECLESMSRSPNFITIDIAHGHHKNIESMIKYLFEFYGSKRPKIIAGNVATSDGYKYLCDLGVDAVKVGIGGGSICSTRYKTGFHLPTAYSIWECSTNGNRDIPIIADGGATHFGDLAKALVLGADMVMSGKWFAECIDSPAKIKDGKKIYRGSTSIESKGHNNHIEGYTIQISEGCFYHERLEEIRQALSSAISYAGGKDLSSFNNVEWNLL